VSKTLSPTLRLGYLAVPAELAKVFAKAKRLADRHTPNLEQDALADLIESGAYERHVRRVRRRNAERRAALLATLSSMLGDAVTVVGADAGLHVVAWLNRVPRAWEDVVVARSHESGVGVYPVAPLYAPAPMALPGTAGLVLGYASLDEPAIEQGGLFGNVHGGSFTEAQVQIILLTDAVTNGSTWAVAFHTALALKEGIDPADVQAIREGRLPKDRKFAALSGLAKTMIEKRGRLDDEDINRFLAAGFGKDHLLEVIAAVAASTITNYTGSITKPPLEAPFQEHAWQG
jgi:alkylhydroperoxidase family enzyme